MNPKIEEEYNKAKSNFLDDLVENLIILAVGIIIGSLGTLLWNAI